MEIKSSEFFKNIKTLPPPGTKEFEDLVKWEEEKIKGGVTIQGVKISGWLYWHLNHWHIRIDEEDEFGEIVRLRSLPNLRDNEWIMAEGLERARLEKKGYLQIGLRQAGKSEMEASYSGMNATIYENTQNVLLAGNDNDLSLMKDKVAFGIANIWDGLRIPQLDKTWTKNTIRLGFKSKVGDDQIWSYIMIRNARDGNNTETAAGTTAKSFIIDEIGKFPFSQSFEAAKPAFNSKFGWRAVPILVGTGGSFENGADAERLFTNPDANNFISYLNEETGARTGLFLSGVYRQDYKEVKPLGLWLNEEYGLNLSATSELDKLTIEVANKSLATEAILAERKKKAADPDQTEYLKQIMYYPLTPEECFLSENTNIYNTISARARQKYLYQEDIKGFAVDIIHDGNKLTHVPSEKKPISSFPIKKTESKDAPVIMWEPPISNPPWGLYVAGVDPYRFDESEYSDSLGAVYIFKRTHSITDEKYQDMFVAAYVARPKTADEWSENALNLIKYYNATAMVENDEPSFIKWVINKGDEQYLADGLDWLKALEIGTTSKRAKGVHRSNPSIVKLLRGSLKEYLNQKLGNRTDEEGNVTGEILGVSRILDPMLLEEIIKFNPDINVDREVAASIAIAYAKHLNPVVNITSTSDPRLKGFYKPNKVNNTFTPKKKSVFASKKRSIF